MASDTAAPGKYPEQLVIMVTKETKARILADAKRHKLSKSEVAREYLDAGVAAADAMASPEGVEQVEAAMRTELINLERERAEATKRKAVKRARRLDGAVD